MENTFEARRTYYTYDNKDRTVSICEKHSTGVKTSLQYVYEDNNDEPWLASLTICHPHRDKKYTLSEFVYRKDGKIISELSAFTYKYHLHNVKAEAVLDIINDQAKTEEESIFKDLKKTIAEIGKKIDIIYDEIIIDYRRIGGEDFDQLFKDSYDIIPGNELINYIEFIKRDANYKVYYEKGLVQNLLKFPGLSNITYIAEKSLEKEYFIADEVEILYFPDKGDYSIYACKPHQISSDNITANYSVRINHCYGKEDKYTFQTNVYEIDGQIYTLQLISGITTTGIIDRVEKITDDFYINMDRVAFCTDEKGNVIRNEVYHVINKVINSAQTDPNEPAYSFYYICTTDPITNKHKAQKFHKIYNMEYKKIDAVWPMYGLQYEFYKYYEEKINEYSKKITVTEYWSHSLKMDTKTSPVRVTETIMVYDKPKEQKLLVDGEIKTYIYYNYSKDGKRLESKTKADFY